MIEGAGGKLDQPGDSLVIDNAGGRSTTHYYDPDRNDWIELTSSDLNTSDNSVDHNRRTMEATQATLVRIMEQMAQVLHQQRPGDNARKFRVNQEDEDIQDYLTLFE